MRPIVWLGLSTLFALGWDSSSKIARAGAADTLDDILARHASARDSVRTLMCRTVVTAENLDGDKATSTVKETGEFTRTSKAIRIQASIVPKKTRDLLLQDSILTMLQADGDDPLRASIERQADIPMLPANAWAHGLFVLPVPNDVCHRTLETLCKQASTVQLDATNSAAKSGLTTLTMQFKSQGRRVDGNWRVVVHLDPSMNYLVRKYTMTSDSNTTNKRVVSESTVTKVQEAAPGIFVPIAVESRGSFDGKASFRGTATMSNVVVNRPVPAGRLGLSFPPGILVSDGINNKTYFTGKDGKPAAAPVGNKSSPSSVPPEPSPREGGGVETRTESWSMAAWVLATSALTLAIAACLALFKRGRTVFS